MLEAATPPSPTPPWGNICNAHLYCRKTCLQMIVPLAWVPSSVSGQHRTLVQSKYGIRERQLGDVAPLKSVRADCSWVMRKVLLLLDMEGFYAHLTALTRADNCSVWG